MQPALKGVDKIYFTHTAFAAVLKVGTVVIWVRKDDGKDSNTVHAALRGVDKLYSIPPSYTAILKDGCGGLLG